MQAMQTMQTMKKMKSRLVSAAGAALLLVSLFAEAQQQGQPAIKTDYGSNQSAGRYLRTRGFGMYYETYGKGAPVLVIHGNGGSIASMRKQIPYFSKHYRVVAADSRSQGRSRDDADSLSYEMMADDCNALMDSLHLDSACVIGWSDGGIIGLLLAARHPNKVKRLAVTGANIRPDSTAVSNGDIQSMIATVGSLQGKQQDPGIKNEIKLTRLMIHEPNISHAVLGSIRCPVLVISGDHDIIKLEHTLEIYRAIPGAELWILPGSGHDTCISFSRDFNEQVGKFFGK
jgi:pimeloyl-ACP methyl ester carboxylesterase